MHIHRDIFAAVLAGMIGLLGGPGQAAEPVTVFAAASLTDAMTATARAYEAERDVRLRLSFAASSTLARQIAAGAPADIYVSANDDWMRYLTERGLVADGTRVAPIGNRLVFVAPAASPVNAIEAGPHLDLAGLLGGGRLAIGDPAHVPAGIYARQALEALGLWRAAEPRLALANDVRAALVLVERGEAPLGIVYRTDAQRTGGVKTVGTVPADSHAAIAYPFAIVRGRDRDTVRDTFGFLTGPEGIAVYRRFGFAVHPAERR